VSDGLCTTCCHGSDREALLRIACGHVAGFCSGGETVASAPASVPRHSFGGKRGLEGEQSSSKTLTLGEKEKRVFFFFFDNNDSKKEKRVALGGFRKFWRERGIRGKIYPSLSEREFVKADEFVTLNGKV
jgi:hypothetical protein